MTQSLSSTRFSQRLAGFVLGAAALLAMVAISHHPVARARRGPEMFEAINQLASTDRAVHGALIVIMFAMIFSFTVYTLTRPRLSICVLAWVAFFAGSMCVIGAALTDGFFVPTFAEHYPHTAPTDTGPALAILNASAVVIQVLTKFGFLALSAGTLFWSIDLVLDRGPSRLIGLLGLLASLAVAALLIFAGALNPHSLLIIVALQALWYLAISYWMIASVSRQPTAVD
ncbi:MAG: hypothetical protein ACJ8M4_12175 [Chthoniobacterales bacterium]